MSISLSKWRHRGSRLSVAWNRLWSESNYTQISSSGQRFFPDPLPLHWRGASLFSSGLRFRPRDWRLLLRETVKLANPSLYLWKAIYIPLLDSTPNVRTGRQSNLEAGGERPASGNTKLLFLLYHLLARCLCCGNKIARALLLRSCMGSNKLITWSHCPLTSGTLQFRRLREHATLPWLLQWDASDLYPKRLLLLSGVMPCVVQPFHGTRHIGSLLTFSICGTDGSVGALPPAASPLLPPAFTLSIRRKHTGRHSFYLLLSFSSGPPTSIS